MSCTKSAKAERCTDITFKLKLHCLSATTEDRIYDEDRYEDINILGTHYFVILNATLGAWQVHATSVHLIFPTLLLKHELRKIIMVLKRNLLLRAIFMIDCYDSFSFAFIKLSFLTYRVFKISCLPLEWFPANEINLL